MLIIEMEGFMKNKLYRSLLLFFSLLVLVFSTSNAEENINIVQHDQICLNSYENEYLGETKIGESVITISVVVEEQRTSAVLKAVQGSLPEPPIGMWYELGICDEFDNWFDLSEISYSDLPNITFEFAGRSNRPEYIRVFLMVFSDDGCQHSYSFEVPNISNTISG